MSKEITCIVCPVGCLITIGSKEGKITSITGNQCIRGIKYAEEEFYFSGRILTTTVLIKSNNEILLPVRSDKSIPKKNLIPCMELIKEVKVEAPVKIGQIIIENILNTGSNIIASKSIEK